MKIMSTTLAAALLVAGAGTASFAQKAKDTLRVAMTEPLTTLVVVEDPRPEMELFSNAVFDTLICYDTNTASYQPLLAKSWTDISDTVTEFKLRDDVKWHDGSEFTADDVVYTLQYNADPASKLRFAAQNLAWLDRVEKIDKYTVRITTKYISPRVMGVLAREVDILPAKLHGSYATKTDFGRQKPIGTGPYKVQSLDPNVGVRLVKADAYPQASPCKPAASIGTITGTAIPDKQTQLAQLTVGGVDLVRGANADEVSMVSQNPDLAITANNGMQYWYIAFDSIDRSGNAALAKQQVRLALSQAINREAIAKAVVPGGAAVKVIDALCLRTHIACDFSSKPPAYDLAAAKKNLAEAGYPNGFDLDITTSTGMESMAEAVGGELRKIGVKATIDKTIIPVYRQKQAAGKIQSLVWLWGQLDASQDSQYFFDDTPRDYWKDETIRKLQVDGLSTKDLAKRKAIYRQLFDRVNEKNYILPISTLPDMFMHTKDLAMSNNSLTRYGAEPTLLKWK